jgi:hypothetical protein
MKDLPRRTSLALVLCVGCIVAACAAANSFLNAGLIPPVLTENFENPVKQDYTTYNGG